MKNENQLTIVIEYEFNNPLIQKTDSLIDNSIRDCHNKYFHTFDHICEYDINSTNVGKNETVNFTFSDKSMGLFELNKKITVARGNGFIFNQLNKVSIKIYSNLSHINKQYYLRLHIPILHRQFLRTISENKQNIQTFCNDRRNPFHFGIRKRFSYNNPQCDKV